MIYCRLKEKKENSAVYYAGANTTDMTGEIEFFNDGSAPILNKQAEEEEILPVFIGKIFAKYKDEFANGEFKKKIAFEC